MTRASEQSTSVGRLFRLKYMLLSRPFEDQGHRYSDATYQAARRTSVRSSQYVSVVILIANLDNILLLCTTVELAKCIAPAVLANDSQIIRRCTDLTAVHYSLERQEICDGAGQLVLRDLLLSRHFIQRVAKTHSCGFVVVVLCPSRSKKE